jgi:hypothetical protein
MRVASLLLSILLFGAIPALGQEGRDYFDKREVLFKGKPALQFRGTLLKAKQDYLIVSNPEGEQLVIWVTRFATLRKKHRGLFNKTRKTYVEELVPGTDARIEAVRDEKGRLLLKRLTVHDTAQEFEPVDDSLVVYDLDKTDDTLDGDNERAIDDEVNDRED